MSALQSRIFNRVVDARLAEGPDALGRLELGDLAFRHRDSEQRGALFEVTESELSGECGRELRERLERLELSPSGPLFGTRSARAGGARTCGRVEILEREAIEAEGLMLADFTEAPSALDTLSGARRPLRVPLHDAGVTESGDDGLDLRIAFCLPSGSFATVVLEEIRKGIPGH